MPRVTILLGKGGTGRTTLGRAFALNSAEERPTTLLHAEPSTQASKAKISNLSVRVLDPNEIVEDAMAKLIPLGPLTRTMVRHPAYQSFLEIAPGIKEAAVLNFVYGFLDWRDDQVVLDGPATGHGLHFLEAPSKLERVLTGKVAERMREVDAMLKDPERTQIVLVALPEELPAIETRELADKLADQGFPVAGMVINRMPPPVPFETGDPPKQPTPPSPRDARGGSIDADDALALLAAQRREAERWKEELEETELPTAVVPSLPGRSDLPAEVAPFVEGFPSQEDPA